MEFLFNNEFLFGEEIINTLHLFIGNWFDYVMIAITRLGNVMFFMLIFPILYWCYDKTFTIKLSAVFLITMIFSDNLKEFFNHPRPDNKLLHEDISTLASKYAVENSPGFPSNHTSGAIALWGTFMYYNRKKVIIILCSLLILLIPYSRIYLGVHFVGDILGGYLISIICILIFIPLVNTIGKNYDKLHFYLVIGAVILLPLIFSIILTGGFTLVILGIFSGLSLGAIIADGIFSFKAKNSFLSSVIKVIIGLAGLFILRIGLKAILPNHFALTYCRYWIIGFWISFLAPLIFSKFEMLRGNVEVEG